MTTKRRVSKGTSLQQRFWIAFGYLSAAVTVFVMVFQVGTYWGHRVAKKEEFKAFITYVSEMKDGVSITQLSCDRTNAVPSERCELALVVRNNNAFECDVWVGATLTSTDGVEYWNTREDSNATIFASGVTTLKRYLTIGTNILPGIYDLHVNLWYGKSSDPSHSERITSATLTRHLTVQGAK